MHIIWFNLHKNQDLGIIIIYILQIQIQRHREFKLDA